MRDKHKQHEEDLRHSLWRASAPMRAVCAPVHGAEQADFVIIGGGFTGLSAAYHLANNGHSTSIIEARQIGWGASGRNGGQVNPALPVPTPMRYLPPMPLIMLRRLHNYPLIQLIFSLI